MSERYDALIIGTGQAGKPLARDLAAAGWKVAIVEKGAVGGTCINTGCTPTKTMVASARVAHLARNGATWGVQSGDVAVDLPAVVRRKREVVSSFREGSRRRLVSTEGVTLIEGAASFVGPRRMRVGDRLLESERIFLNTGTRAAKPDLPGLDAIPWMDHVGILELETLPDHLVILGGGVIGVEFAQMFRRFGSRVTLVHRGAHLLAREDEDVAEAMAAILREDGVDVRLGVKTDAFRIGDLGGSHLLVAVGRTPNTDALNLAVAGVETDARGYLRVNDRLETNVPGIWALGDVNGGPQFTHVAYDDYRIVARNLLGDGKGSTTDRLVPWTVFTDPQLGRIGLTEAQARAEGRRYRVAKMPMDYVARALEMGESRGFMKALVELETDRILGAAVLGIEGGEIATMLQLAMMGGLTARQLHDAVFPHPGFAEALNNLFA
ncbi:MAG TPA: mercuric reductase [Candidatus Polarisedimenticolaceae bacterium]